MLVGGAAEVSLSLRFSFIRLAATDNGGPNLGMALSLINKGDERTAHLIRSKVESRSSPSSFRSFSPIQT